MPDLRITREEATATATSWLADRGVDTAGMAPVTTLLDHGSIQEYQVLWTARLGAVRLPRIVQVSINPETGVVCSFLNNGRSYVDPPAPKLTLEDATAAARAEERDAGANVTSSELVVTFDPAGAQVLVYELRMTRSNGFFVMLDVDALTGAVTVVGRG